MKGRIRPLQTDILTIILRNKTYETEVIIMAEQAAKKTFKVPHLCYPIFLIVVATIGTYVIPAGVYDRVTDPITNRSVVDPLSYHLVATPSDSSRCL